ncbi:hypothetical protein M501DRAFT_33172 [Patellaria atrata CBS 101060]|uniref:Cation chloride cotransporter n=1 Tax=Patellaria atrata CBS 101060 TaxID=1346257 RepID=A0A9P4VVB7_9PEZI|nr:hypothetical protein M501DRAFT_33172 [Patellaria atrata CBS 101060]
MAEQPAPGRIPPRRTRSNFLTRAPTDDTSQLSRRTSIVPPTPSPRQEVPPQPPEQYSSRAGNNDRLQVSDYHQPVEGSTSVVGDFFSMGARYRPSPNRRRSSSHRRKSPGPGVPLSTAHLDIAQLQADTKDDLSRPKPGAFPRPVGGTFKLGTFAGVFVPTSLNVLSILMFLRFGFILGQAGVTGTMGMLIVCYAINLITTMSISAIATNGTVRGGGAYYLISRSLGPEFGGSIGIVLYMGFTFGSGMNAVGLVDCVKQNFGSLTGSRAQWLPEGFWWEYLWGTIVLLICTAICLAGSGIFARASNGLLVMLLIATFSIPLSTLFMSPFESRKLGIEYTGLSRQTFLGNLSPRFTKGAAGSQLKGKETFQDLFGILFPATGGIFAGASMSGDLKHPSKAIPKGTLYGLLLTFFTYSTVILAMAGSITRASLYRNVNVISEVNVSGALILLGEFATSFFSTLMGVIGSAKLLQALARDNLIPGLSIFGQGTKVGDEPTVAIIFTYAIAQVTMLADINQIASLQTMAFLMTFLVTNLACFLLKISSAPNFRPSFHYFNWWTAAIGTIFSGATMFFVDGVYASGCVALLISIFLVIHFFTPPKSWGDVSQSLIYHQVRKYLLRLRQEHVKYWRPQILLFINDPRRQYKLIQFCNSLKKGALFVLGHVIVTPDFGPAVPEARRQQHAWRQYIDFSKIKAFVNIAISPGVEWGVRNIVLSTGLGGMRPNIVVMGFYNLGELKASQPLIDISSPGPLPSTSHQEDETHTEEQSKFRKFRKRKEDKLHGALPTDTNRPEGAIGPKEYVTILEDLLLRLRINVAIGKNFQELDLPTPKPSIINRVLSKFKHSDQDDDGDGKKFIDLWPIQMSAEIAAAGGEEGLKKNILTTNFDTYTLILQLGCILHTVDSWRRVYKLRVAVFVEYETDVEEERGRVTMLLANLRIEAQVLVFWLASGDIKTYEVIVNGASGDAFSGTLRKVDSALEEEEWWHDIQTLRGIRGPITATQQLAEVEGLLESKGRRGSMFRADPLETGRSKFQKIKRMLKRTKKRASIGNLSQFGALSLGMTTHRLDPDLILGSASESSSSDEEGASESRSSDESQSRTSAVTENDIDDYRSSSSEGYQPATPSRRSKSVGYRGSVRSESANNQSTSKRTSGTVTPETSLKGLQTSSPSSRNIRTSNTPSSHMGSSSGTLQPPRPPTIRQHSMPKFTSKPVPRTEVSADEGPGPSIMFTDQPSPPAHHNPHQSIYKHSPAQQATGTASGFPFQQSLALSFNDLPCRAQHLILNELMIQQSGDTAVVFTTLPSPVQGTCESDEESLRYLMDLEGLCRDMPPVLLVHSNSMTVTMNL